MITLYMVEMSRDELQLKAERAVGNLGGHTKKLRKGGRRLHNVIKYSH